MESTVVVRSVLSWVRPAMKSMLLNGLVCAWRNVKCMRVYMDVRLYVCVCMYFQRTTHIPDSARMQVCFFAHMTDQFRIAGG